MRGFDPDPQKLPVKDVFEFNKAIIDATADLYAHINPTWNSMRRLAYADLQALKKTIACIGQIIPIIGDAKRGDIGNTADAYAKALLGDLKFDAVTVNPYLGYDSVEPFLQYKTKESSYFAALPTAAQPIFRTSWTISDTGLPVGGYACQGME